MSDRPTTTTTTERTPRGFFRRGLYWPALVAAVFLGNIALATWVLILSGSDPSFAVEENYYEKALNWNDEIDQRQRNAELGWSVALQAAGAPDEMGTSEITLRLDDADGDPLRGATVRAEAFPIARGHDRRELAFDEVAPGAYAGRVERARPGLWELRVAVEHEGDRFTARLGTTIGGAE